MTETEFTNPLELKLAGSSTAGEFSGLASAFSLDSHGDVVRPGAYTQTIKEHKAAGLTPPLLWSHDLAKPIGRIVTMAEDDFGLNVTGKFNLGTTAGKDAHAAVKAGDLNGLSIGYRIPPGGATTAKNGVRTLQRVDLQEISLVTLPSNKDARIRQVKTMINSSGELERILREVGLSKRAAENIVAHGYAGLSEKFEDEAQIKTFNRVAAILRRQSIEMKGK